MLANGCGTCPALGPATVSPHTVPGPAPCPLCCSGTCHLSPSLGPPDPYFSWAQASGCFLSCNQGAAASVSGNKQKIVKLSFSAKKCHFLKYKVLFSKCFTFDDFSLYLGQVLAWPVWGGELCGSLECAVLSQASWACRDRCMVALCHQRCGHCWCADPWQLGVFGLPRNNFKEKDGFLIYSEWNKS